MCFINQNEKTESTSITNVNTSCDQKTALKFLMIGKVFCKNKLNTFEFHEKLIEVMQYIMTMEVPFLKLKGKEDAIEIKTRTENMVKSGY